MTNEEVQSKIENLADLISFVDDTVKFNIGTMWAVVGIVLAAGAIILPILAKTWADKAVNNKLDKITTKIKNDLAGKFPDIQFYNAMVTGLYHGKNVYVLKYEQIGDRVPSFFVQAPETNLNISYKNVKSENTLLIINREQAGFYVHILIANAKIIGVSINSEEEVKDLIAKW